LRARSRILRHPQGTQITTPLVVPSFSSKGFGVAFRRNKTPISEVSQYLQLFADRLNRAFLVSAYDLHYKLLEPARELTTRKFEDSLWSHPKLLFIDSGLYECRIQSDSDEPVQEMRLPQDWSEEKYVDFAARLPTNAPIALVNWDHYQSYRAQIDAAQEFFTDHGSYLSVCLLKPEKEGRSHNFGRLTQDASRLAAFRVVGVTEKELGASVIERLVALAKLRDLLDREGVDSPIHVFGALHPLYTPLYFAAGGEIFDGLSWLRYLWFEGVPVHRDSLPILFRQSDKVQQQGIEAAQAQSLDKVEALERRLRNFLKVKEWSVFGEERAQVLEDAYLDMESEL